MVCNCIHNPILAIINLIRDHYKSIILYCGRLNESVHVGVYSHLRFINKDYIGVSNVLC